MRVWIWSAAGLFVAGGGGCAPQPIDYVIEYRVSGTAKKVDVVYTTDAANKQTAMGVSLPWKKSVVGGRGTMVLMVVRNASQEGDIQGTVLVDNRLIKSCQADGGGATAECGAGSLP